MIQCCVLVSWHWYLVRPWPLFTKALPGRGSRLAYYYVFISYLPQIIHHVHYCSSSEWLHDRNSTCPAGILIPPFRLQGVHQPVLNALLIQHLAMIFPSEDR